MAYPANLEIKPDVTPFFHSATNTISYVVKDPNSDACAVVDSVMDIDYADEIIAHIRERGLRLEWLIETHIHADHLSGAPYIQQALGGKIGIGRNITVGTMDCYAIHTPGHTPACMTHVIGNAAFVGAIWPKSMDNALAALPDETRLFMCHDYGAVKN